MVTFSKIYVKRLQLLKLNNINPYLIIKYAEQDFFTSVANNNKKYYNWSDVFKINLMEKEGTQHNLFIFNIEYKLFILNLKLKI